MLKFLVQTVDGNIRSDITLSLVDSVDFLNWKSKGTAKYKLVDAQEIELGIGLEHDYVPVGTIEFVHGFIERLYGEDKVPKPLNIPDSLLDREFTNRDVFNVSSSQLKDVFEMFGGKAFVKNNDKLKSCENGAYYCFNQELFKGKSYMVSELVDIESEYRCFIYNNDLIGINNYSGDFTVFPDISKIRSIISEFKDHAPVSYTLDVGCYGGETFIIELHNFYSCGLYGFSDYSRYPYMLYRWFKEYQKKINIF